MMRRMGRPGLIGLAARTAVVAGTASAVSGGMQRAAQNRAAQQQPAQPTYAAPAPAPAPAAGAVDIVGELQKLAALQQAGVLSADEFAAAKAKLLA